MKINKKGLKGLFQVWAYLFIVCNIIMIIFMVFSSKYSVEIVSIFGVIAFSVFGYLNGTLE